MGWGSKFKKKFKKVFKKVVRVWKAVNTFGASEAQRQAKEQQKKLKEALEAEKAKERMDAINERNRVSGLEREKQSHYDARQSALEAARKPRVVAQEEEEDILNANSIISNI